MMILLAVAAIGIRAHAMPIGIRIAMMGRESARQQGAVVPTGIEADLDGLPVIVEPDGNGGWMVTLTNDISSGSLPIDIPDNIGPMTIDLNGHDLAGPNGEPAIRIVPGEGDGAPTVLTVVTGGGDAAVQGGEGAPAIVVVDGSQDGVTVNVGEGVTVQGGGVPAVDGTVGENEGTLVKAVVHAPEIASKEYTGEALSPDVPESPLYSVRTFGSMTEAGSYVVLLVLTDPENYSWEGTDDPFVALEFRIIAPPDPPAPRICYEVAAYAEREGAAKGSVTLSPKNGLVRIGETATMSAKAGDKKSVFAYWLDADGNIASYTAKMNVKPDDDAEYRAVFRLKSKCVRPVFDAALTYGADGFESSNSMVDVAFKAQMTVNREAYPVKFSAKGLPKGLKINATTGVISGIPTKAGTFTATITVKSAANTKLKASSKKLKMSIAALPNWAKGSFGGIVHRGGETDGSPIGQVTLAVGATGKISGKIACGGTNWTFSASGWTAASVTDGAATNAAACRFVASGTASCKAGKKTVKKPWTVTVDGEGLGGGSAGSVTPVVGNEWASVAEGTLGGETLAFEAQRNFWKDTGATALLEGWMRAYTYVTDAGDRLTVTVGAYGAVKVAGTVGGRKLSLSTTLLYLDADGQGARRVVFVYAPPTTVTKKNKKGKVTGKVSYPEFIATVILDE